MAKKSGRDRDRTRKSPKAKNPLVPVDAPKPGGAEYDLTLDDIERTGELPDDETLEERHPGVTSVRKLRKEFIMRTVFKLRNQQYRVDQIAKALKLSERAVWWYVKQIEKAFEQDTLRWSYVGQIGKSIAVFKDAQAYLARMLDAKVYKKDMKDENKLRAIRELVNCEQKVLNTLKHAGFFESSKLKPVNAQSQGERRDIDTVRDFLNNLRMDADDDEPEEETIDNCKYSDDDVRIIP